MSENSLTFPIRGGIYVFFVGFMGVFGPNIVFEGAAYSHVQILMLASAICLGQAIMSLRRQPLPSVLALFLCDAALIMSLVKVSGASASPFLVLFPLLAISGAVIFPIRLTLILVGSSLVFSGEAVGWGLSVVSSWVAILAVSFLGTYLVKLLSKSGADLKVSETARKRLENLQKAILANIPSGLMSVDDKGLIIQVNQVGGRILGLTESAVLNRSLLDLVPGFRRGFERLDQVIAAGGKSLTDDLRNRQILDYFGSDGKVLKLGYSLAALEDPEDGHILGTLVVFQDLTQILKLEEDLRMSEKLAAVGKLAAGIAHEIRNPLAGISGSAQLLSGTAALGSEDAHLLTIIQRESVRLDGLITEFLEYVRPHKLELRPIDLSKVVSDTVESLMVNSKWKDLGCKLDVEAAGDAPLMVQGDANKITQVLFNFILNAGQAKASRVVVRLGPGPLLQVLDDGGGISPANMKRLFEPFFTTKDKGTGLGLAISYRVLEAMGARVKVLSPAEGFAERGGSVFKIEFQA
jgi:two-component system sensor histidine kinase PilS (NtrC family)